MKRHLRDVILCLVFALLLLSGCQYSNFQVPENCDAPEMIAAFDKRIPGSTYVPTEWQPAEGTLLKIFLDNQGIACTYGIQSAEVGGTVMWTIDTQGLFAKQSELWKSEQYRSIDIEGINESEAYLLPLSATGVDGAYIWEVNLLIEDLWISFGGSFIQDISEATDIINTAIEVARR
jgi:hypothetical protein